MALRKELEYVNASDAGTRQGSTNSTINKKDPLRPTALVDTATGNITTTKPNTTTKANKIQPTAPKVEAPKTDDGGGNNGGGNNDGGNTGGGYSGGDYPITPAYEPPKIAAPTYQQSQAVSDAYSYLQSIINNRPGAFSSSYASQLQSLYDSIMNRDKFQYDLNNDALYQQYARQYAQQGQQAMQNTMANAAALSGGYGSSYATTAGQQAYNAYLSQLNDVAPELYSQAYGRYQDEGNALLNQYSVTNGLYNDEYNRYRDAVSDYENQLNYAYNNFNNERDFDYNQYLNNLNQYNYEVDRAYQQSQDALAQQNRDRDYAYQVGRDAINDKRYDSESAYQRELDAYNRAQNELNSQASLNARDFETQMKTLVNYGNTADAIELLTNNMDGASYSEILKAAKGYGITEEDIEEYIKNAIGQIDSASAPKLPNTVGNFKYAK